MLAARKRLSVSLPSPPGAAFSFEGLHAGRARACSKAALFQHSRRRRAAQKALLVTSVTRTLAAYPGRCGERIASNDNWL